MNHTIRQQRAFKMFDHHTAERRAFIRMETKRQKAIEQLGERWVFHPNNPDRPRRGHYNNFGLPVL